MYPPFENRAGQGSLSYQWRRQEPKMDQHQWVTVWECESDTMFEQLDNHEKAPQVSLATTLGIFAAYLVGAFGGICIFIVLARRAFGIQIASAITYTYFEFWYVFFPTRGLLQQYSLHDKMVQRRIPLLLAIHSAFLMLIFVGETVWFSMKPQLLSYWFTEHGKPVGPLYVFVVIGSVTVAFFIEVLISRRILSRGLGEGLAENRHLQHQQHQQAPR
jgi:hypothetical protein